MPIVLKPNQMYYKDPDTGDYKEINVLAEEATATKLAEINAAGANEVTKVQNAGTTEKNKVDAAGATQVSAVQQKGVETLESIPDDYTELSDDVADLKSAIDNISEWRTGLNIYDEEHNSTVWPSDNRFTDAIVYLDGYTGDLVVSTEGTGFSGYFRTPTVKDANGNILVNAWIAGTVYNASTARSGKRITIPSGAVTFEFAYQTSATSGELVHDVMVTKGSTITDILIYEPYYKYIYIKMSQTQMDEIADYSIAGCAYVSPNGDDDNDGLTHDTAVRTFSKALSINRRVKADRGNYYEDILAVSNIDGISITPYDNDDTYSEAHPKRDKIRFVGANEINKSALSNSGTMYSVDTGEGTNFTAVFINQSLQPIVNAQAQTYRANVHVIYSDISKKIKLKPVLSLALCEAEGNTFFWDGTTLSCNITDGTFDKIAVVTSYRTMAFSNCNNAYFEDIVWDYSYDSILKYENSNHVIFKNCEANYCSISAGFAFINTNATLDNCYATHNGMDGFNFHEYGTTIMNDCIGEYNYDDGCSHHEGCSSTINGGRFTGNGKCGIAPAYGAYVNIHNVICDGNPIGIGYLTTGNKKADGNMLSCALVGNTIGLSVNTLCTVKTVNCVYSGNTTDKNIVGTLIEY